MSHVGLLIKRRPLIVDTVDKNITELQSTMQLGMLNSSIININPSDFYVSFPEDKRDYTVIRKGESSFANNTFHMTVWMLLQN